MDSQANTGGKRCRSLTRATMVRDSLVSEAPDRPPSSSDASPSAKSRGGDAGRNTNNTLLLRMRSFAIFSSFSWTWGWIFNPGNMKPLFFRPVSCVWNANIIGRSRVSRAYTLWCPFLLVLITRSHQSKKQLRARQISAQQINKIEELWKTNPDTNLEDLEKPGVDDEPQPVGLKYEDAYQYQNIFAPLIKLEADYDKMMKESQSKDNLTIRWDIGLNKKRVAYFVFPKEDNELRLVPGDELRLRYSGDAAHPAWQSVGHVVYLPSPVRSMVEMQMVRNINFAALVLLVFQSLMRLRAAHVMIVMLADLEIFGRGFLQLLASWNVTCGTMHHQNLASNLLVVFSGHSPHKVHLVRENCYLRCHRIIWAKQGQGQVLVCAPSNVAVDQLAEKISATGLKVVRLCAKSREAVSSPVEHLTLHYQVRHLDTSEKSELYKLQQLKDEQEREIAQSADVICCTCVGAGDPRLANFRFRQVLIDESTQAAEPECLIPLVLGAKQLGPVIMCKKAARAGLAQSLFERLVLLGVKPIRLQSFNSFYEGTLQNGVTINERQSLGIDFPWPVPNRPMFFYVQVRGRYKVQEGGANDVRGVRDKKERGKVFKNLMICRQRQMRENGWCNAGLTQRISRFWEFIGGHVARKHVTNPSKKQVDPGHLIKDGLVKGKKKTGGPIRAQLADYPESSTSNTLLTHEPFTKYLFTNDESSFLWITGPLTVSEIEAEPELGTLGKSAASKEVSDFTCRVLLMVGNNNHRQQAES
ncbi:ATP-dependent helicase NAM7 [Datura stramonium]|uniref:ATP-dependent helicase NAM7 n=1 Tax=Datura stramonium TaxID=4076 RepID=A0ABS8RNS1_DATST|nr:ATP-dependent helicase NAM7 [Datura stramonium]